MDDKMIATFCLGDDLLKAIHHQEDRQWQMCLPESSIFPYKVCPFVSIIKCQDTLDGMRQEAQVERWV